MGNQVSAIEREIINATAAKKRRSKETPGQYRCRLIAALDDLSDAEWHLMSPQAQEYAQKATVAVMAGREPDDFPDLVDVGTTPPHTIKDQDIPVLEMKNRGGADLFRKAAVEATLQGQDVNVKKLVSDIHARGFKLSEATASFTLAEVVKTIKIINDLAKKEKANDDEAG